MKNAADMHRLFTEHPETVGETYGEHLGVAFSFGSTMIIAGFACLLHGLFPFLFEKTGSEAIRQLHRRMVAHRDCRQTRVKSVLISSGR